MKILLINLMMTMLFSGAWMSGQNSAVPGCDPASVAEAVEALYPGARILDVDGDDGRIEVEISDAGRVRRDVYFTMNLEWILTKTSMRYPGLPQTVKSAFDASQYASARVDDVNHYVFASGDEYYILELDSRPWDDVELKILPDGTLTARYD